MLLRSQNEIICPLCHLPFSWSLSCSNQPTLLHSSAICPDCYQVLPWSKPTPDESGILSAFDYTSPINALILMGKQAKGLETLYLLSQLVAEHFKQVLATQDWPEAIIPIPLHPNKLRQRGFNQALELIRPLAKQLTIPILTDVLKRHRQTAEQKSLSAQQRHTNVENSFYLAKPLSYQHIALFDDVVTTGATLQAAAQALQLQSSVRLQYWACARTKQ